MASPERAKALQNWGGEAPGVRANVLIIWQHYAALMRASPISPNFNLKERLDRILIWLGCVTLSLLFWRRIC
jgi:hypothetical protein